MDVTGYLAGSIFYIGDELRNQFWAKKVREAIPNIDLYSPIENQDINGTEGKKKFADSKMIAEADNARLDKCDILISFNLGEDLKPLSKVASGGEMSRVMLALKAHLFLNKNLSTVIFDEIDTGMSGSVAEVVAKKLKEMSEKMQVFSITHLPIVASNADHHLFVKKNFIDDKTVTCVVELSFDEKVNVISEMISPNDTTGKAKEVAKLMLLKNK